MSYFRAQSAGQLASGTAGGLTAVGDSDFLANYGKEIGIFLSFVYFVTGCILSYFAFAEYKKDPKKSNHVGFVVLAAISYLLTVIDVGYMWLSRDDPDKDKVNKYTANIALIPFYIAIVILLFVFVGIAIAR